MDVPCMVVCVCDRCTCLFHALSLVSFPIIERMKNRPTIDQQGNGANAKNRLDRVTLSYQSLPVKSYAALQSAIGEKLYGLGVDPLAAAEWSSQANSGFNKVIIS